MKENKHLKCRFNQIAFGLVFTRVGKLLLSYSTTGCGKEKRFMKQMTYPEISVSDMDRKEL